MRPEKKGRGFWVQLDALSLSLSLTDWTFRNRGVHLPTPRRKIRYHPTEDPTYLEDMVSFLPLLPNHNST